MLRALCLLAFAPLFVAVATAQIPDPGRPPGAPADLGTAYVYNNTAEDIVYVVSSAKGTVRDTLRPGWAAQTYFQKDGRLRVLTTFVATTGHILSNRTIKPIDGNYYDAIAPSPAPVFMKQMVEEEVGGRRVQKEVQIQQIPAEEGRRREIPPTRIQRAP